MKKTIKELEALVEQLTKENESLKLAEENYKIWYKMMDRTVDEIYKKYLQLQSEKLAAFRSIKELLDKS